MLLGSLLASPSTGKRSFGRVARLSASIALLGLFFLGDLSPYLAWRQTVGLPRGRLDSVQAERLRIAVARNPLHPDLHLRTAENLAGDGSDWTISDYAGAREAAEHAVRLQPADASYRCAVARVEALACRTLFKDGGSRERARRWYEQAQSLARYDPLLPLEEGIFLLRASDPEGARRAAERALRIEPQAIPARLLLAEAILAADGSRSAEKASSVLDEAVEIAARWRDLPKETYYARQLLVLDAAHVRAIRDAIARQGEAARGAEVR
jgi:tetratricopeptide (TPR) repeat protein